MLRKIPIAVKIASGAALVISTIVFVTYIDHQATDKYQRICQEKVAKVPLRPGEQNLSDAQKCQDPKQYMPWWYVLISWPEGIGGWALLGTGFVIAWQSYETRKAAANAGKQLAFQKETLRPRLSVTEFTNDLFNEARLGEWVFAKMQISNTGGMPAYGVITDTWIEFVAGDPPYRFSPNAKYARARLMNVYTGKSSGFFIPLHRRLTEEERHLMAKAHGAIIFRVRMQYRAFADEFHTDEAFLVRPKEMESLSEYGSAT